MKKGFFILLILLFVSLAAGKVIHQLSTTWDSQQEMKINLQENIAKQKAKLQKMDDDITRTQAKPSLSDHDRWLIAHLGKSREKLHAAIIGLEETDQYFYTPLIRNWVGHGFMLVIFVLMTIYALAGRSSHLTREEKRWLESHTADIPELLVDPGAYRNGAAPISNASNFVTGRIKPRNQNQLHITRSSTLTAMGLAFMLAPQGTLAVDIYFFIERMLNSHEPFADLQWSTLSNSLMVSIPFTIAGFYVLFFTTSGARIDRRKQQIHLGTENRDIAFRDVESLQLNQLLTTGERSFINSQIQLNLRDGSNVSLLSHAGKEQMYVDLIRLALFMDKPVALPATE